MRTTVVIEDALVEEGMRITGARTKRELVELGIRELIHARKRERLRGLLGKMKLSLTPEELKRLRNAG